MSLSKIFVNNTQVANVDSEIVAGSDNLTKNDGINRAISIISPWNTIEEHFGSLENGYISESNTNMYKLIPIKLGDTINILTNDNAVWAAIINKAPSNTDRTFSFADGESSRRSLSSGSSYTLEITLSNARYFLLQTHVTVKGASVKSHPIKLSVSNRVYLPVNISRYASIVPTQTAKINITDTTIIIPAYLRIIYGNGAVYRLLSNITLQRVAPTGSDDQSEYVIFHATDNSITTTKETEINSNILGENDYILFTVSNGFSGCSLSPSLYTVNGRKIYETPDKTNHTVEFLFYGKGKINITDTTVVIPQNTRLYYDNNKYYATTAAITLERESGSQVDVICFNQSNKTFAIFSMPTVINLNNDYISLFTINHDNYCSLSPSMYTIDGMNVYTNNKQFEQLNQNFDLLVNGNQEDLEGALYSGRFSSTGGTYRIMPIHNGDTITCSKGEHPGYFVILRDKQVPDDTVYHYASGENDRHIIYGYMDYTINSNDAAYVIVETFREGDGENDGKTIPSYFLINGIDILNGISKTLTFSLNVTRYASIVPTQTAKINITDTTITIPSFLRIIYGKGYVYRLYSNVVLERKAYAASGTLSDYVIFDSSNNTIFIEQEDHINSDVLNENRYILFTVSNGLTGCSLSPSLYKVNGDDVYAMKSDIVSINNIIQRNKYKETAIMSTLLYKGDSNIKDLNKVSFLHFSDLHGNSIALENVIKFRDYYLDYFDDTIHTGDTVANTIVNTNLFETISGALTILNVAGNHEAWLTTSDNDYRATEKQVYDKIFANNISNWNVILPGNVEDSNYNIEISYPEYAAANGLCYYYKDYRNFRLIVLDNIHWHSGGNAHIIDDPRLLKAWFEKVLADAREKEKVVICAMHYPPIHIEPVANVGGFNVLGTTNATDISDGWVANDEIFGCVDTFINLKDTNDKNGKFGCWLIGHTHCDYFGYVSGHTNQAIVVVNTAGSGGSQDKRISNTTSYDCFNIITFSYISATKQYIKIARIGNDMDIYNRSKKFICFNIVDGTVVSIG